MGASATNVATVRVKGVLYCNADSANKGKRLNAGNEIWKEAFEVKQVPRTDCRTETDSIDPRPIREQTAAALFGRNEEPLVGTLAAAATVFCPPSSLPAFRAAGTGTTL